MKSKKTARDDLDNLINELPRYKPWYQDVERMYEVMGRLVALKKECDKYNSVIFIDQKTDNAFLYRKNVDCNWQEVIHSAVTHDSYAIRGISVEGDAVLIASRCDGKQLVLHTT